MRVTTEPIDPAEALGFVSDPASGATCLFLGTVRDHSERGEVQGLRYEAWAELAETRLLEICDEIAASAAIRRAAIIHRYGDLLPTDISVAVACSAAHRAEAFEACRLGIERLKQSVPIWKQEHLASGDAEWVMGS